MTMARICGGSKCIADPNTPHAFKCVDSCYNVVCKSGYTTEVSGDGCCCVATSCPSGQRLENGKCVANCTGVTCKSGYKAVSNSTGCCCEADTPTCSAAQVYHPILKNVLRRYVLPTVPICALKDTAQAVRPDILWATTVCVNKLPLPARQIAVRVLRPTLARNATQGTTSAQENAFPVR